MNKGFWRITDDLRIWNARKALSFSSASVTHRTLVNSQQTSRMEELILDCREKLKCEIKTKTDLIWQLTKTRSLWM